MAEKKRYDSAIDDGWDDTSFLLFSGWKDGFPNFKSHPFNKEK